jgi:uncharacterized protein (TIGR00375 family)
MDLEGMAKGAKLKGVHLLGTSDFTHPSWLKNLKEKLQPIEGTGLFQFQNTFFMLTGEVATYFVWNKQLKRVHHVLHAPSFEVVEQLNESLAKHANLSTDGRPILNLTAPELVELCMEISKDILLYPAHAWTPWMSCFGSQAGFDSLKECYQDQAKHIHALETGMSSDPALNWRLHQLDSITLVSNSDSHSPWTWRLGREANVFELKNLTYWEVNSAIKEKDKKKFLFTIETSPCYGKYHWDGHRNCKVSLHPKESLKLNNLCPKCGRKLTIGVLHRVEQLADRPEGFVPKDAIPFKTLLPLYEIISFVTGVGELYSKKVLAEHDKLIARFGNELNVLLNVPREELTKVTSEKIADAIIRVREGRVQYTPGYDGVYGKPVFDLEVERKPTISSQRSLTEF